jgi:hypothetical protein
MGTHGPDATVQPTDDEPHHFRRQSVLLAERLVDSPRLDADVDSALTPLGRDRGVLVRFAAIDVLLAAAVAGAATLDPSWLLAPLMMLLFISLGLVIGMFNQLLSDPVG